MAPTVAQMIKAGALRQLCNYYVSLGGKPANWGEVREYALREFRDVSHAVINELIANCKVAQTWAEVCNSEVQ